jgi:precorrin-6Y C5,15-methyltransferase (decarboxylating)
MSDERIYVMGIGADGPASLRREQLERIETADFLAGGERHLGFFPGVRAEKFVIKDSVAELTSELVRRRGSQRCVVLASGDPLFHGIGKALIDSLGADHLEIEPAVSSMQLAFARTGRSWQDAALASVHGRDLRTELLPLLGRELIGLFTSDGDGPGAAARFFLHHGLRDYQAVVGENLGTARERLTHWTDLEHLKDQHFEPLNYLVLVRTGAAEEREAVRGRRQLVPGVADDEFARPEEGQEVMTRQEVRSVLLGKLAGVLQPGDTVWDIGAGLGTVSVEIAVLRPAVEVLAVERDPGRLPLLKENRERFGAYNIRIIEGTAPEALAGERDRPRVIFIGGSGTALYRILDQVDERLRAGGRLLANFVTLEHLMTAYQRFHGKGWKSDITHVQAARSDDLGGQTGLKPQRGVFILRADKPGVRW